MLIVSGEIRSAGTSNACFHAPFLRPLCAALLLCVAAVADPLPEQEDAPSVSQAISRAAVQLAQSLRADAIITPTQTGATARQVARYRPSTHIVAVTPSEQVCRQLALTFGVVPLLVPRAEDTDGTLGQAVAAARAGGLITPGELLVLTAGVRANTAGATNLIKVEKA